MTVGYVKYSYTYIGIKGLFLFFVRKGDRSAIYASNQEEQYDITIKEHKVGNALKELVERR